VLEAHTRFSGFCKPQSFRGHGCALRVSIACARIYSRRRIFLNFQRAYLLLFSAVKFNGHQLFVDARPLSLSLPIAATGSVTYILTCLAQLKLSPVRP